MKGPPRRFGPERRKFMQQRVQARFRGVAWELTYEEWLDWWQQTGHLHERGRHRGQYVMARIGDVGPYALGNIICILGTDNFTGRHAPKDNRGERNPRAILSWEQVREIRASTLPRLVLAEQYNVSPGTIKAVRAGRNWKEHSDVTTTSTDYTSAGHRND